MKFLTVCLIVIINAAAAPPACGKDAKMNKLFKLPEPSVKAPGASVEEAINRRQSVRRYSSAPLSLDEVSCVLWAAAGKRIDPAADAVSGASRTFPSAGAAYPLEFYLIAGNITGLKPAVYRYLSENHSLEMIIEGDRRQDVSAAALGQSSVKNAPACILISAVYARISGRYGQRGIERYAPMEAGHSGENIYLISEAIGLGTVAVGAFDDEKLSAIMGFTDGERPLYIFPFGKKQK